MLSRLSRNLGKPLPIIWKSTVYEIQSTQIMSFLIKFLKEAQTNELDDITSLFVVSLVM